MGIRDIKKGFMKKSLRNRILNYVRKQDGFVHRGDIERLAVLNGFMGSNAARECRRLEVDGLIERDLRRGKTTKSVWYKATPPKEILSVDGIIVGKRY